MKWARKKCERREKSLVIYCKSEYYSFFFLCWHVKWYGDEIEPLMLNVKFTRNTRAHTHTQTHRKGTNTTWIRRWWSKLSSRLIMCTCAYRLIYLAFTVCSMLWLVSHIHHSARWKHRYGWVCVGLNWSIFLSVYLSQKLITIDKTSRFRFNPLAGRCNLTKWQHQQFTFGIMNFGRIAGLIFIFSFHSLFLSLYLDRLRKNG